MIPEAIAVQVTPHPEAKGVVILYIAGCNGGFAAAGNGYFIAIVWSVFFHIAVAEAFVDEVVKIVEFGLMAKWEKGDAKVTFELTRSHNGKPLWICGIANGWISAILDNRAMIESFTENWAVI